LSHGGIGFPQNMFPLKFVASVSQTLLFSSFNFFVWISKFHCFECKEGTEKQKFNCVFQSLPRCLVLAY